MKRFENLQKIARRNGKVYLASELEDNYNFSISELDNMSEIDYASLCQIIDAETK